MNSNRHTSNAQAFANHQSSPSAVPRGRRWRRVALSLLATGSMAISSLMAFPHNAAGADAASRTGGISILIHRYDAKAQLPAGDCSLVDVPRGNVPRGNVPRGNVPFVDFPSSQPRTTFLGTHDSMPIVPHIAAIEPTVASTRVPIRRTSPKFGELVTSLIASTAMRAGIPLQPMLEPFAMVRSIASKPVIAPEAAAQATIEREAEIDRSVAQVKQLDRWWLGEPELVAPDSDTSPLSDMDMDAVIAELASQEPIDVSHPSQDSLVGSGWVIATIEEPYYPYDLAEIDLDWSSGLGFDSDLQSSDWPFALPPPARPFDWDLAAVTFESYRPLQDATGPTHYVLAERHRDPLSLPLDPSPIASTFASPKVSPDCILDELIWDAATWAESVDLVNYGAARLGQSIGRAAIAGHRLHRRVTESIVRRLPATPKANPLMRGTLQLAMLGIPEPVADPLPDADPAIFDTAMFLLTEPTESLEVALLPVADPLPDAQWSDFAEPIESLKRLVAQWSGPIANQWSAIATAKPTSEPEAKVAKRPGDDRR